MEAVGSGEDRADGGVGAFVAGVGDPVEPGVGDLVESCPEGFGQLDELRQLGSLSPRDPPVEQPP